MTRSKSTAPAIDHKIFRKQFMDKIIFMEEDDAPVDVGSPQKKQKKVMEAWVCTNDPFLQQMKVWTAANPDDGTLPDKNSRVSVVKYHEIQLQVSTSNSNRSQDNIEEETDEKDEVEVVEKPIAKRVKREKERLQLIDDILKENIAPNCVVVLSVVPCVNGILERGSNVHQYNQTFQVKRLFFDSQRTIAMAGLQLWDDDLVCLTIPAARLQLCEADFHKDRQLQCLQNQDAVDEAFRLFSAIKRSLSFVRGARPLKKEICVATDYNRKILNFPSGKLNSVRLQNSL